MKPRITVLTLGVEDLEKSVEFYKNGLGLKTEGIIGTEFEDGAVAFFDLENGMKLGLWPKDSISKQAQVDRTQTSHTEFTIGHNVSSKSEVDEVLKEAELAGAKITDSPHETFYGGYSGHFMDLDGHLWEVAWNPDWSLDLD